MKTPLPHRFAPCHTLLRVFLLSAVLFTISAGAEAAAQTRWETGVIARNGTLNQSLAAKGMPTRGIHRITSLLSPHVNMRRIQPDRAFRFSLDGSGEVQEFLLELDGPTICQLTRDPLGRYRVSKRAWKRQLKPSRVSGEVLTTLEEVLEKVGEAKELAVRFREILAEHVGLCPYVEPGDGLTLIVDKIYAEDKVLRYGEIQSFVIRRGGAGIRAFRYQGHYYDEKGISLGQQFLRVPLDYHYVSSDFMKSRKHPILGGIRPHKGIDFAAPFGTPVRAAADGEVVSCGWKGGYGFAVQLKHRHGYETLYGHLQRYGFGIREGARVRKKQIVGYVGATGLATGPHLHYTLTRDGKVCDPLWEQFPRERITGAGDRIAFQEKKREMLALLGDEPVECVTVAE